MFRHQGGGGGAELGYGLSGCVMPGRLGLIRRERLGRGLGGRSQGAVAVFLIAYGSQAVSAFMLYLSPAASADRAPANYTAWRLAR